MNTCFEMPADHVVALRSSPHWDVQAAALRRAGIQVVRDAPANLEVSEQGGAMVVRSGSAELCRVSSAIHPDDLAEVVLLAVEWWAEHGELGERTAALHEARLVAHDTNNALTAMFGALALLERQVAAEAQPLLREIESAGRAIGAMTQAVLAGGRSSSPPVIDVNAVILGFERSLRRLAGPSALVLELGTSLPPARVAPVDLERAILNLLRNALAATRAGGDIVLSTSLVGAEHQDIPAGRWLAVTVEDSGAGMDEASWRKAMDALSSARLPHGEHGYGLASVARVARSAGGHVTLRSSPGAGTVARVLLPACDAPISPVA
jgi:signal transduction histidine kinase